MDQSGKDDKNLFTEEIEIGNKNSELSRNSMSKEKNILSLQNRKVLAKIKVEGTVDSYNVEISIRVQKFL